MEQLQNLVVTLDQQHNAKADYIIGAKKLIVSPDGMLEAFGTKGHIYEPNEIWHRGAAEMLNIPLPYYRRMQQQCPDLLASNINKWFDLRNEKTGIMLRTFEGFQNKNIARAILSDRYNILDNYDVLFAALDAIKKSGIHVDIEQATVTDRKMYVVITCPEIAIDAREILDRYRAIPGSETNNGIISGLIITNSEVGDGKFEIRPRAMILKCKNGLIANDDSFSRVHLGAKLQEGQITWSDATKQKNYELVISQTNDAIGSFLSRGYLSGMIQKIADAVNVKLNSPADTVENVCRELSIPEDRRRDILSHFITGGDAAASGVFHAITRGIQEMGADDRFDLEAKAFMILPRISEFDKPISKN